MATARAGSEAPAAAPTAAVSQTPAAVVRPRTESRRTKISPAPMKPIPETIWAATREGSRTTSSRLQHVEEAVLADQHEERRADADQRVGPQPGAFLPQLAVEADRGREHQRQPDPPDQVPFVLPVHCLPIRSRIPLHRCQSGSLRTAQPTVPPVSARRETPIRSWGGCLRGAGGACLGAVIGEADRAAGRRGLGALAVDPKVDRAVAEGGGEGARVEGADALPGGRVAPSTSGLPAASRTQAQTSAVGSIFRATLDAAPAPGSPCRRASSRRRLPSRRRPWPCPRLPRLRSPRATPAAGVRPLDPPPPAGGEQRRSRRRAPRQRRSRPRRRRLAFSSPAQCLGASRGGRREGRGRGRPAPAVPTLPPVLGDQRLGIDAEELRVLADEGAGVELLRQRVPVFFLDRAQVAGADARGGLDLVEVDSPPGPRLGQGVADYTHSFHCAFRRVTVVKS